MFKYGGTGGAVSRHTVKKAPPNARARIKVRVKLLDAPFLSLWNLWLAKEINPPMFKTAATDDRSRVYTDAPDIRA